MSSQKYWVRISHFFQRGKSQLVFLVFELEVSCQTFDSGVLVFCFDVEPLASGQIELMTSQKSYNPVDLHKLLLLNSQQCVVLHLLLDAVRELFPVQISYQIFELNFVNIIRFSKRVDINLNEVVVGHWFRQVKACSLLVINLSKPVQ